MSLNTGHIRVKRMAWANALAYFSAAAMTKKKVLRRSPKDEDRSFEETKLFEKLENVGFTLNF